MPLHIDNKVIEAVEAATLRLLIETEDRVPVTRILHGRQTSAKQYGPDYSKAFWSLEIVIDADEEDCTPSFWAPIDGSEFPARMHQTTGARLVAGSEAEASYGVHGPALDGAEIEFVGWPSADSVLVRWTAEYDKWDLGPARRIPFSFEGKVAFSGIEMRVKQERDATPILSHVLPMLDQSALVMSLGREIILQPPVQVDRKRWREVFWRPKAS